MTATSLELEMDAISIVSLTRARVGTISEADTGLTIDVVSIGATADMVLAEEEMGATDNLVLTGAEMGVAPETWVGATVDTVLTGAETGIGATIDVVLTGAETGVVPET